MNWLQKVANIMIVQDILNLLQTEGVAYLRYVRVGGEYRFGHADSFTVDHISLANGEPVKSAAYLKIYPDGLRVIGNSMTLKIGPASDDESNLSQLLSIPIKEQP